MSLRCKHEWIKQSEVTLPSAFEQITESFAESIRDASAIMFQKKYILVLSCKKCGKLDKTIEKTL